jgi:hypothetical protein
MPSLCREARGGDVIVPAGTDWLVAYEEAMTAAHDPAATSPRNDADVALIGAT